MHLQEQNQFRVIVLCAPCVIRTGGILNISFSSPPTLHSPTAEPTVFDLTLSLLSLSRTVTCVGVCMCVCPSVWPAGLARRALLALLANLSGPDSFWPFSSTNGHSAAPNGPSLRSAN